MNLLAHGVGAAVERLEDVRQLVGRDAGPAIFDRDVHLRLAPARHLRGAHADPLRLTAVLEGVDHQVLDRGRRARRGRRRSPGSSAGIARSTSAELFALTRADSIAWSIRSAGASGASGPSPRPDSTPAYCSTLSTISPRRRASPSMTRPYCLTRSLLPTTPCDRFSAAERITAIGVRSSCETPATNSICWRASRCARLDAWASSATLTESRSSTPKLMPRLRRRTLATAASSDPLACWTATSHRPRFGGGPAARPSGSGGGGGCRESAAALSTARRRRGARRNAGPARSEERLAWRRPNRGGPASPGQTGK